MVEQNDEIEKKFDKFFYKLVPASGKADTVMGEIVRAISRLGYRNYNDGDYFFEGYGCETCGSSATYLKKFPEYRKTIEEMEDSLRSEYENGLDKLYAQAVSDCEAGKYCEENTEDSREYQSDYFDDNEEEYDYYDYAYGEEEDDEV